MRAWIILAAGDGQNNAQIAWLLAAALAAVSGRAFG
jgi:hypothetical protein